MKPENLISGRRGSIRRHVQTRSVFVFFCFTCMFFLIACSQKKPEIHSTDVQLLRVQGPAGKFAERLSVFVFFTDGDGVADFNSISITHDETGLVWNVPASSCMTRKRGKDLWTGTNSLAGPGDELISDGSYTVAVTDLAGNESLSTFTLSRPAFPDYAPVTFTVIGDSWSLVRNAVPSGFSRTWLFLYDAQLNLVYSWRVPDSTDARTDGTVAMLRSFAQSAVSVQCYTENANGTAGVLLSSVTME